MYISAAPFRLAPYALKGQKPLAQGIALGIMAISKAPCKHPQPCIEYVVVHELAHIVSKNHDTQFKAVLDKHLPLWEKYKNELNEFII